ncbi:MAG: hypothetical protein HOW97_04845 [Catenulispora sp.]|nr:hypothetical protein [Catenulispora sp.]
MNDKSLLRSSQVLIVLDEILHAPRTSLRALELVGRGIAAEARVTLTVVEDEVNGPANLGAALVPDVPVNAVEAYEDMKSLTAIEEDLADLWRGRCQGDVAEAAFEARLGRIVERLETWTPTIRSTR